MRFFFHIAFHGYNYRGWQSQRKGVSIQETIENALSTVFQQKIIIHGCGRTDAQVNASQYFFHTTIKNYTDNNTLFRINKLLPKDIVVLDIIPIEKRAQAQFHAISRTYEYYIHGNKNPFLEKYSCYYPIKKPDLLLIAEALEIIKKQNDFKPLCKTPDKHSSTICNVSEANIYYCIEEDRIKLKFTADHFLKNMIRIIVKKLIEIGEGKLSIKDFELVLNNEKTFKSLKTFHAHGLYLSKVVYPNLDMPNRFSEYDRTQWKLIKNQDKK